MLEDAGFAVDLTPLSGEGRAQLVVATRIGGARGEADYRICSAISIPLPLGTQLSWSVDSPGPPPRSRMALYGRGSSDMKSGVAAPVMAALAFPLAGKLANTPRCSVMYITAGEETGCTGAAAGDARSISSRVGALVAAEPTGNQVLVGHKGALWLEAVTTGVTAHGSMPEKGVNAVYKRRTCRRRAAGFTRDVAGFGDEPAAAPYILPMRQC